MKYTVDYFIQKFEAIPEDNWIVGTFYNELGCCARGWCGTRSIFEQTLEDKALQVVLKLDNAGKTGDINNGRNHRYQQPTPKQRILAALKDAKQRG